jgi:hypothetical protein
MDDNEAGVEIAKLCVKENIWTLIAIAVISVGVGYFTQSGVGLWSLLLLMNLNSFGGSSK